MARKTQRAAAASTALLLLFAGAAPNRASAAPAASETAAASGVTLERIMADPDWQGRAPENAYWGDDGRTVYYEQKQQGKELRDLVRLEIESGKSRIVPPAERGGVDVAQGRISHDGKHKVYARKGDLYLKDLATGEVRQLTRTGDVETDPQFLVGDGRVAFHSGGSVYVIDLKSGMASQPADLKLEKDPADEEAPGFLEAQQIRYFDVLRDKKEKAREKRLADRDEQKADPTRPPLPWYLGDKIKIANLSLSPNGEWLLVTTAPKSKEADERSAKRDIMPAYVTESGYVETRHVHGKVGEETASPNQLILLDLRNHKRHDLDLGVLPGIHDDPLKALREKAEARGKADKEKWKAERKKTGEDVDENAADADKDADRAKRGDRDAEEKGDKRGKQEQGDKLGRAARDSRDSHDPKAGKTDESKSPKTRPVTVLGVSWSDDGTHAAVEMASNDFKDRWIATFDAPSPKLTSRHRLTDPAWVNWAFNDFGWLHDSPSLWFLSEESGYSQLYTASTADGRLRALTHGKFEVSAPVASRDGRYVYYLANSAHPGQYDVFRVTLAAPDAALEQITKLGGLNTFQLSTDETQLLVDHSSIAHHDELYVQPAAAGATARALTDTLSAEYKAIDWTIPEIVAIPSSHGAGPIYSRVYTPKDFDPSRQYPAVFFIHGAGYLQNSHYGWSSYSHEFLFSTFLNQHGYVVIDMDYRASAGYGRAWRTAIYRQMGHPELEDLADGVAWLAKTKSVDPKRVGAFGGSYGGFLVLMALFREPDLFAAGAALRPVTDWAHYNQGYTGAILNTPEVDPEAYETSSPIEFATGLRKPLLICHGMVDDNVFFEDTVRLVQRLIELKKENFETAFFPVERHGFVQPTSWLDEYRRIYKLMATNLK